MDNSDEPADVAALQKEVDALRERNRALEEEGSTGTSHRTWGQRGRSASVVLLLVLATLCMTLSPLAIWGRNLVLNTDRYVQTLSPIATDPGVQKLVVTAVDRQVDEHVDINALVQQTLPPRAAALAVPLESAFQGLVNTTVTRFVQSRAFQVLWVTINRTAHSQLVYLLTGKIGGDVGALQVTAGKLVLNLAPVVEQVKNQLVAAGLTVASHIPVVGATITIAQVKGIQQARKWVRVLNTVANFLPWLGLVLFGSAIAVSTRRRRTLTTAALCTGGGMILIGLVLLIVRHIYLGQIDPSTIPHNTAQFLFDTVVRFLRDGIRIVLAVALLIAFIAWFTGPSPRVVGVRTRAISGSRALIATTGSGAVGQFVVVHSKALRITVVALALIVLIGFSSPTVVNLIVLAVIAVLLLMLIEAIRAAAGKGTQEAHPAA